MDFTNTTKSSVIIFVLILPHKKRWYIISCENLTLKTRTLLLESRQHFTENSFLIVLFLSRLRPTKPMSPLIDGFDHFVQNDRPKTAQLDERVKVPLLDKFNVDTSK